MLNLKYQVVFREHNRLNLETIYIGPFETYDDAYDALCNMPAIGNHVETEIDGGSIQSGVKYIEPIFPTYKLAIAFRTHCMNYDGDLEDAVRSFEI
jgi:hypothetical protein